MDQQDIDELTEVFVEESQEIVESLNHDVLQLEQYVDNPAIDRDLVNNIFRYVHTLKGNSGLAGADKLRDLAHKMESLLDRLRKDKIGLSAEIVDILFDGIDRIGSILKEVMTGSDLGVVVEDLIEKIETILTGHPVESKGATPPEVRVKKPKKPEPASAAQPLVPSQISQYPIPDEIKRILTEYEENRLIRSIRSNLRIYEAVLNLAMEGFDRIVTAVIDNINIMGEVIAKVPSSKTLPEYDLQVRIIFASPASAQQLRESLASLPEVASQDFSIKLLMKPGAKIIPSELSAPTPPTKQPSVPSPAPVEQTTVKKNEVGKEPLPKTPTPVVQTQPVQEEVPETVSSKTISLKDLAEPTGNTVRVDIKKLDNLMNIVGELVLAKARYVQFESELNGIAGYKMLRDSFKRNNKLTSKKLEDLREGILQVRMVQIGTLFNRFPRIVRDLAKNHNKQIQLLLEGKETELDKAVVDEMGDPLIHLIRNAVDHGIEDQLTRRHRGKPAVGKIILRAYQEGSYIVIEMEDDGSGMNVERIREKAVELGLIERGIKLSESEILSFIFHPGFSTARRVTDTSGRGVGMDVVKLAISRLKGIIDIHTKLTIGTKFIIKLPLTLAIIQVLLIKIHEQTYAIPLSSVIESFKLDLHSIEIVDEQEVTQLRNIVLPLLRLHDVFRIQVDDSEPEESFFPESISPASDTESEGLSVEAEEPSAEPGEPLVEPGKPPTKTEEEPLQDHEESLAESEEEQVESRQFVVVIGLAEKRIGLVVDHLLGQQEIVIKPLGRYLVNTPGFAGATTLGDGRVVLILDVVGLIENLNQKKMSPKHYQDRQTVAVGSRKQLRGSRQVAVGS